MDQRENKVGYADLSKGIELLISKFGIDKTAAIIRQITDTVTIVKSEKLKTQLLLTYIYYESQHLFKCKQSKSKTESSKEFKDSRMVTYHLIKKYTNMSYQQLGKRFGQSKRAVIHHYNKCESLLSIPKSNKDFVSKYQRLEQKTIQYMTTLK
ncbi:hypothetical protein HN014_10640 [Aquimarina sp. TRL1]|uniref:hypothetical protein n=1 Tax=Aquimarina sp. (strain TRL1) TaxID=2736252 RepID=UPI00158F3751|nr:hypothetical protein [Aquimarina sp. TRL1]QKX05353.1 hypothetical protein HN014_10640 [Aquimarina sp. TRL1]